MNLLVPQWLVIYRYWNFCVIRSCFLPGNEKAPFNVVITPNSGTILPVIVLAEAVK